MLVCAPTGAGKTNIAMLAVLHEVGQNMRHGVIQKQDFKVVYVAPMKALAAEVTAAFSRRLGPMGKSYPFILHWSVSYTRLPYRCQQATIHPAQTETLAHQGPLACVSPALCFTFYT